MEHFLNIPNGSDLRSSHPAFLLHTPTYSAKPLAETLLARRLDCGEKVDDRKSVKQCSPLGRDPSRGYAWEPDRRI